MQRSGQIRRAPEGRPEAAGTFDVLIVGGGPAGLSAALVLARCRRKVLLIDSGRPRNSSARRLHNFLSRNGVRPGRLLELGRAEATRCGAEVLHAEAASAERLPGPAPRAPAFRVSLPDGRAFASRKLLLATGVTDALPAVEGVDRYYGRGVHHCPYCDAFEYAGRPLLAYGRGRAAAGLALTLRRWSDEVTACTDGEPLSAQERACLAGSGVAVRTERLVRLEGQAGSLRRAVFARGPALACAALFFNTERPQHSALAERLGCRVDEEEGVQTGRRQATSVGGLYLAGDAAGGVQFAVVAAAEGATAAVAINRELQEEDGFALPCARGRTRERA